MLCSCMRPIVISKNILYKTVVLISCVYQTVANLTIKYVKQSFALLESPPSLFGILFMGFNVHLIVVVIHLMLVTFPVAYWIQFYLTHSYPPLCTYFKHNPRRISPSGVSIIVTYSKITYPYGKLNAHSKFLRVPSHPASSLS